MVDSKFCELTKFVPGWKIDSMLIVNSSAIFAYDSLVGINTLATWFYFIVSFGIISDSKMLNWGIIDSIKNRTGLTTKLSIAIEIPK